MPLKSISTIYIFPLLKFLNWISDKRKIRNKNDQRHRKPNDNLKWKIKIATLKTRIACISLHFCWSCCYRCCCFWYYNLLYNLSLLFGWFCFSSASQFYFVCECVCFFVLFYYYHLHSLHFCCCWFVHSFVRSFICCYYLHLTVELHIRLQFFFSYSSGSSITTISICFSSFSFLILYFSFSVFILCLFYLSVSVYLSAFELISQNMYQFTFSVFACVYRRQWLIYSHLPCYIFSFCFFCDFLVFSFHLPFCTCVCVSGVCV